MTARPDQYGEPSSSRTRFLLSPKFFVACVRCSHLLWPFAFLGLHCALVENLGSLTFRQRFRALHLRCMRVTRPVSDLVRHRGPLPTRVFMVYGLWFMVYGLDLDTDGS